MPGSPVIFTGVLGFKDETLQLFFVHTCLIYISFSIFNVSRYWVGDKVNLKLLKKV